MCCLSVLEALHINEKKHLALKPNKPNFNANHLQCFFYVMKCNFELERPDLVNKLRSKAAPQVRIDWLRNITAM